MRAMFYPLIAASLLLGACATEPEQKPGATGVEDRGKPSATPRAVESKPVARVDATGKPAGSPFAALKDPSNILSKRSVFFDFDKFDVKDEFRPLVEAHAKFLRENTSAKMLIQGNADERGSREYNVGLGQRRSDSLKKMLTLLGAREDQIESVSLGEEKPSCADHTEDCWSKNRRDDMLYSGEY
ncbi:MAG TPA: peptidoglycan-associated lipoprotein Pal [Burkholderiales bacterium]